MKIINYTLLVTISLLITTGCSSNNLTNNANNIPEENNIIVDNNSSKEVNDLVKIRSNNQEYIMQLEDNETVKSFINILPLEITMNELNGNEKYIYLNNPLPINPINPNHINTGDVMLYGDNCLVIFYKSFDTSYSYTKIGHIEALPDLENNNITVKINN